MMELTFGASPSDTIYLDLRGWACQVQRNATYMALFRKFDRLWDYIMHLNARNSFEQMSKNDFSPPRVPQDTTYEYDYA